jgi:L-aminoadipate-semialdehyde dehydrogenase
VTAKALKRKILPNPVEKLVDWQTAWPGPIHQIFMKNALHHPERFCVVESFEKYNESRHIERGSRNFTYKQVNDASSLIAQALLNGGVDAGDVVVIYAHRGVELVVAIMGVLKAGATFSVIGTFLYCNRDFSCLAG